jgi:hypothetical protein
MARKPPVRRNQKAASLRDMAASISTAAAQDELERSAQPSVPPNQIRGQRERALTRPKFTPEREPNGTQEVTSPNDAKPRPRPFKRDRINRPER